MSHTTIASTRDYLPGHDKGDLTNPAQSASFTVDPLLVPVRTSQLPKPVHPDPSPADNPELFDQSTRHPNSHYHPEAKLSKKKRAKKLGTGYVAKPHGGAHDSGGVHAGGRTFSEHEKEAHERTERRDAAIAPTGEEAEEEWETDEEDGGDSLQQEEQSHSQHAENRITGTETQHGTTKPTNKRNDDVADKLKNKDKEQEGQDDDSQQQQEGGEDKEKGDNPSLIQRASNVLSTAQQRASDVAGSVTSTVMSTAQSVPVVGTLLSKMGLGGSKDDGDKAADDSSAEQDKSGEAGDASEQSESSKQTASGAGDSKPVGGQKEKDTEAVTKGAGAQATSEAAGKSKTGEVYGKQAARQDNNEGALDKSRSQAGQKEVNAQAKKEEEA